jgi:hypothetical protein
MGGFRSSPHLQSAAFPDYRLPLRDHDDRVSVRLGGAMNRLAVIAKLKPEAEKDAEELITKGPPFDPSGLGFERHSV